MIALVRGARQRVLRPEPLLRENAAFFIPDDVVATRYLPTMTDPVRLLPGWVVAGTGQKSMVLSTVIRLGGERFAWHELAGAIRAVAEVNRMDQNGGAAAPEEKRDEMGEELCIHDMAPGTCALCSPRIGSASASMLADTAVVYVSPSHVGHLAGCSHKDDEDFSRWGEITRPGAWQDLRNGRAVAADTGSRVGLVANEACKSCIARS
ncbi:hypothetical protein ACQFYA_14155 [Promicromonospora sp. Marseille-Q5078]